MLAWQVGVLGSVPTLRGVGAELVRGTVKNKIIANTDCAQRAEIWADMNS